jgi:hypothetical protein
MRPTLLFHSVERQIILERSCPMDNLSSQQDSYYKQAHSITYWKNWWLIYF